MLQFFAGGRVVKSEASISMKLDGHSPALVGAPFIHSLVITGLSSLPSGLQKAALFVSEAVRADQTLQKVSKPNSAVSDRSGYLENQTQGAVLQGRRRCRKAWLSWSGGLRRGLYQRPGTH